MSSSTLNGSAAAAQKLGSISLGESLERKDNDTKPAAKDGTPAKMCSKCGKKSDALKKCNGCKCVWYCDKDCQNKHWKDHKIECRRIKKELDKRGGKLEFGTEKDLDPLPELPPKEECPICMHVLPPIPELSAYASCCGKMICCGCNFQHQIRSGKGRTCAFCRTTPPVSHEGVLAGLRKRVVLKDPQALLTMALVNGFGYYGLPVDQTKCIELLRESADLGFPPALHHFGIYHDVGDMGLEQNEEDGLRYYEEAAEGGHLISRHNVGCTEGMNGNVVAAMRHWRLAASGGIRDSMGGLIGCFEDGLLHHGCLAETMQAFYRSRAEMRSDDRDQYIAHLKKTGGYEEHYDY